jgi:type VI secretion system protein ImpJ
VKNNRPIYWHQGLFLQPQHFQLADLYFQSLVAPLARFENPYLWGVSRIKINTAQLADKTLVIEEAELVFPDGSYLEFPGNALILPRSFEGLPLESGRPVKVYLGLKSWAEQSANVTVVPNWDEITGVTTRFAAPANPEEVADLYLEGSPMGQVKRLQFVPKIFWETEKEQLNKYDLFPIAQLVMEEEVVKISLKYVPPSLKIGADPVLLGIVKDLSDKVGARCRRLEEYKSPQSMQGTELEPGVFFLLMGLRALTKYVPWLASLVEEHNIHPWSVYQSLLQLAGELTLFSKRVSATGDADDGSRMLLPYNHLDLYRCFQALHDLISMLLDEITFGPESIIRLNLGDLYFEGKVDTRLFSDRNNYYLSLRTASDPKQVKGAVQSVIKLSAKENLAVLTSRALPGLPLEYVAVPPPGLPQLSSTNYYRIDVSNPQWDDVQRFNNLAMHWNNSPSDLIAEVIVMRRS